MKWNKVEEHAYYSDDDQADVTYRQNNDGSYNWYLDIDGIEYVDSFPTCREAQYAYELFLRTGIL